MAEDQWTPDGRDEDYLYGDALDRSANAFLEREDLPADITNDFEDVGQELVQEMSLEEAKNLLQAKSLSPQHPLTRPPMAEHPAEVVAIVSSLQSIMHDYYSSLRLKHFLCRKRIRFILVDVNKDVMTSHNLRSGQLMQELEAADLLLRNQEGRPMIPQCLFDGVSVGDEVAVQDLEEDGDLDFIINRARCPMCLAHRRSSSPGECEECGRFLDGVIPLDLWQSDGLFHMYADHRMAWDAPVPPPSQKLPYKPVFTMPVANDARPYDMDY